jgi:hypothetical protein
MMQGMANTAHQQYRNESLPKPRWRKQASDSHDQSLLKYWDAN